MIIEAGSNPDFLDTNAIGFGTALRVAYVQEIILQHKTSDGSPYLQFDLIDQHGIPCRGMYWEVQALAEETSFGWAIGHLVELEFQAHPDRDYLTVSYVRPLSEDYSEFEVLGSHFKKQIPSFAENQAWLAQILLRFCTENETVNPLFQALRDESALVYIAESRNPRLCSGAIGGRLSLVSACVGACMGNMALFAGSPGERRRVVIALVLYEFLLAKHEPLSINDNPLWRVDAMIRLNSLVDRHQLTGPEVSTTITAVLSLLGMTDVATELGTVVKTMRDAFIVLSDLHYKLALQPGDLPLIYNGHTFVK